ncbi:hypothetical protein SAMN05428975_5934 [Mucilaginibacter sp. OK268]|uniref:hypothetical protein n=1 Tax=Mucilaginibacter sp. OK268 TaxID=1881048 RepID=UPI00088A7FDB|nr:hypothetical protein [Mucilaginibacter sp. OK268]SDQ01688.1 hypothetical protein SAMN05428975_5934 [Mucilaginibacter sp. OK268]
MKLNSISIRTVFKHPHQFDFNIQTWCIQEQYWSYLKKYDVGQFRRIIVRVNDTNIITEYDNIIDEPSNDVIAINKYFDIASFLNMNVFEKKRALLELLHNCMLYLAGQYGWEKESLLNAYHECVESNLEYKFKVKNKDFKSPTKEFIGYIQCYWDIDKFTATGVILRKDEHPLRQEVIMEIEPYHAEFIYYSTCKWDDPYTFSLYSKEGKKWSIAITSKAQPFVGLYLL